MTLARRMQNRVTAEERAEIKREIVGEIRDAMFAGDSIDAVREALDERDPDPLSYSDVAAMDEAAINSDWARVSKVLEAGPGASAAPTGSPAPSPSSGPRKTGQQLLSEGNPGPAPLSRESISRMSHEEIISRSAEINAWLARGGRPA